MNMPYQSWEILPVGLNHTQLSIAGGMVEITIDVKVIVSVCIMSCSNTIGKCYSC